MKLATGVDLIEVARVESAIARHGGQFLRRVFTEGELRACGGRAESLAARFAAKEAVAKALGRGIGDVSWQDIEILGDENHMPTLVLRGVGNQVAQETGLQVWSISISHTHEHAMAFVVGLG